MPFPGIDQPQCLRETYYSIFMTEEETVSVTVASVKEIAKEVDNLLNTIRGTVELLAVSGFQEDVYHPSLRAVKTMAGRAYIQPVAAIIREASSVKRG